MVLDGKKIAKQIKNQVKKDIINHRLNPGLAVVLIGKNPASKVYVSLKQKAAQTIGIRFKKFSIDGRTSQKNILILISKLNKNKNIHGIIVQMPLPKHLDPGIIVKHILPEKDVDGFRTKSKFISPTHQSILRLLKESKKKLKTKKAIILCKNHIFANPLINLLKKQNIRAFWNTHPSKNLKSADIIISALGKPKILKLKMIKKNSIIIDVGYNRVKDKPVGDVDQKIKQKAAYLSPVPGGVGPLTVAYLLRNVYLAAKKQSLQ